MELTTEQIEFIRQDIREKGMTMSDLSESLLDHICCSIENDSCNDFHEAYSRAMNAFGSGGLKEIQQDTIFLLIIKKQVTMKKTMYFFGYIAAFSITTGLLFKIQHWPGASIMLVLGIVLLNFAFLPMYFYDRYKRAISQ